MLVAVPGKALELAALAAKHGWKVGVTTDAVASDEKEVFVVLNGKDHIGQVHATWSNGKWKSGMLRRANGSVVQMNNAGAIRRLVADEVALTIRSEVTRVDPAKYGR